MGFLKSEYKHTPEHLTLEEAKARALAHLKKMFASNPRRAWPASWVANAIWPGHTMSPQGAGLAASRALQSLERDGLIRYTSEFSSSRSGGWIIR